MYMCLYVIWKSWTRRILGLWKNMDARVYTCVYVCVYFCVFVCTYCVCKYQNMDARAHRLALEENKDPDGVYTCVCVCVCVCVCGCVNTFIYISMCVYVIWKSWTRRILGLWKNKEARVYMCVYVCVYVCVFVCKYCVCKYIYIYVCICDMEIMDEMQLGLWKNKAARAHFVKVLLFRSYA